MVPLTSGAVFGGILSMLRTWLLAAVLTAFTTSGRAQTVTGTLECRVVDGMSSAVMSAEVSVKNDETGFERAAKTNHEGYVQITFLPVGPYTVTVGATGFAQQSPAAVLELNAPRTLQTHRPA